MRVLLGGLLALAGLLSVTVGGVPRLHESWTSAAKPQDTSWDKLTRRGLFDNAHLRLDQVTLRPVDAPDRNDRSDRNELSGRNGGSDRNDLESGANEGLAASPATGAVSLLLRPFRSPESSSAWSVVPVATHPDKMPWPDRVRISGEPGAIEAARAELANSGTLTGTFRPERPAYTFDQWVSSLRLSGGPQIVPAPPRFVYRPVTVGPEDPQGLAMFLGGLVLVSLGTVIAGSGRAGWWVWLIFPPAGLLSRLGKPLRRPGGDGSRQLAFAIAGGALAVYGYRRAIGPGRWALVDVDYGIVQMGCVLMAVGVAAFAGAVTSLGMRRWHRFTARHRAQPDATAEACRATIARVTGGGPTFTRRYMDPRFTVVTEVTEVPEWAALTEALEEIDFEPPLAIEIIDDDRVIPASIQLGCQDLVMAIVKRRDGSAGNEGSDHEGPDRSGFGDISLISVLEDGCVVVSRSTSGESGSGTNGFEAFLDEAEPVPLVAAHLEQVAGQATLREASVVPLDGSEWRDLYLLAARLRADFAFRKGLSNRVVDPANLGRFRFKPTPSWEPVALSDLRDPDGTGGGAEDDATFSARTPAGNPLLAAGR